MLFTSTFAIAVVMDEFDGIVLVTPVACVLIESSKPLATYCASLANSTRRRYVTVSRESEGRLVPHEGPNRSWLDAGSGKEIVI